ncbi:MAG TPA: DNA mismatch repair protein MutS, partial [Rhizobiales bacterium]|nr:DNA mismatch repair protein MutS [Hyphomicrobiales bacterium]
TTALEVASDLARFEPSEVLISEDLLARFKSGEHMGLQGFHLVGLPAAKFDSAQAERRLKSYFQVQALEAFGAFSRAEMGAAGALLDYIEMTQVGKRPSLNPPRREMSGSTLRIDAATRANLELVSTLKGERRGSLLDLVDKSVTGAGGREMAARLTAPLTSPEQIQARLDEVAFLAEQEVLRSDLRKTLKACPELARSALRLSLRRGGPRDLLAIRGALRGALALLACFAELDDRVLTRPENLVKACRRLQLADTDLLQQLDAILDDEVPLQARDGGFVRSGYSPELDELRRLRDESRKVIASRQAEYAQATGIKTLKIRHNNVLGYFIEVTPQHADRLMCAPLNQQFIHRQTLASSVRFTTVELNETQARISRAGEQALVLEQAIFDELSQAVLDNHELLGKVAEALASVDVAAALGELAVQCALTRPVVDDSHDFKLIGARHLVVEAALEAQGESFVANDCDLNPSHEDRGQIWLLTGPNMAGKSTFLRQNALIAILAQMGSFVPAKEAHIGIVDQLFSRVGAADDLARGRSTFMVEMVETAVILNQAGARSLVILDEIGRGTSTFDGLSIAWACVEHLHETNKCRALFATHFHELTALSEKLDHIFNATVKV